MTVTGHRPARDLLVDVSAKLGRRWPTGLALAGGGVALLATPADGMFHNLSEVLVQLPVIYVLLAVMHRPRLTWLVFIGGFVLYGVLQQLDVVEPTILFLAIALAAAVWGVGHGGHREPDLLLQFVGMVLFGGLAIAAFQVHPDLARYLLAVGWLGHAVWDAVHLVRKQVVAPSYAEACGVLDVLIGVRLILL